MSNALTDWIHAGGGSVQEIRELCTDISNLIDFAHLPWRVVYGTVVPHHAMLDMYMGRCLSDSVRVAAHARILPPMPAAVLTLQSLHPWPGGGRLVLAAVQRVPGVSMPGGTRRVQDAGLLDHSVRQRCRRKSVSQQRGEAQCTQADDRSLCKRALLERRRTP